MNRHNITPANTEIVILCFEGPDPYAMAGGLGMRVDHLSRTLAEMGFPTHLFFIGDPKLPGEEARQGGQLILHRWCQWISQYYPRGVYEGENEKLYDFNESIPGFVKDRVIRPAVAQGKLVVVLGEEWHTAEAMCRLSDALHDDGLRDQVVLFWNANNTYSFYRINWPRLRFTTTITTVSRYMKHLMWQMGLNPLVIPNGIARQLLGKIDDNTISALRAALGAEVVLFKMARWDPDKNWEGALKATWGLKERGLTTVLVARGGVEPYGQEVLRYAHTLGLRVKEALFQAWPRSDYLAALHRAAPADVLVVRSPIPLELSRLLYRAANAVLANSRHEPFGLVGLEAMAAGGVAVTGSTGEDYTIPLVNAIVLETTDPREIEGAVLYLRGHPDESDRIRRASRRTARLYTWEAVARTLLGKLEYQARLQGTLGDTPHRLGHRGFLNVASRSQRGGSGEAPDGGQDVRIEPGSAPKGGAGRCRGGSHMIFQVLLVRSALSTSNRLSCKCPPKCGPPGRVSCGIWLMDDTIIMAARLELALSNPSRAACVRMVGRRT